ncbi:MAG: beta-galactosidase trimerization domain-containing protein, partial [Anaerolineae bacterium]|nr:beta-galactosidase trimerization domain-containing protein [Anaerolineae bacterium]
YKVVFAPDLYILPDAVATALNEYVERGGVLFCDARTGVKDETSLCHERTLPGLLSDALGVVIEEYEALDHPWGRGAAFTYEVTGAGSLAGDYTATLVAEWAQTTTAEPLAGYKAWHMEPFAAATRNQFGKGWGYFLGTVIQEEGFYDLLVADILEHAGITAVLTPPAGVETSLREGEGKQLLFLVNHTEQEQIVAVPAGQTELLTGVETGETWVLDRYGVAVIQLA